MAQPQKSLRDRMSDVDECQVVLFDKHRLQDDPCSTTEVYTVNVDESLAKIAQVLADIWAHMDAIEHRLDALEHEKRQKIRHQ